MSRPDLAALSDDALVSLANRGLVKRAHKMLAKGVGPDVSRDGDAVVGLFPDGVETRLEADTPLGETGCSCGAPRVCRHRIAVVIAFREAADGAAAEPWSPAEFDDALLLDRLGERVLGQATRAASKGIVVEVLDEGVPTARLETCTVRFLVPHDIAYARCDCSVPELCEHIAVAVWAWRKATEVPSSVELGSRSEVSVAALEELVRLSRELLRVGVVNAPESLAQTFAVVRSGLAADRLVWPLDVCEDLEATLGAYRSRSARYRSSDAAALLMESTARLRAAKGKGRTPPGGILGTSVAAQTTLEKLTLVGLGCRMEAFDRQVQAEIYLADPASGTVLVARKTWEAAEGAPLFTAPQLRRRVAGGGTALELLSAREIHTEGARRKANRLLQLGKTAAPARKAPWQHLSAPLMVASLAHSTAHRSGRAPRMLRPRLLAEGLVVLPVASVHAVYWRPGEQAVVALVEIPSGELVRVVKRHRAVVPGACAAVADAFESEDVHLISGELLRGPQGLELDPLALAGSSGVTVPELAPAGAVRLGIGTESESEDLVEAGLAEALALLAEGAHMGLTALSGGWAKRLDANRRRLEAVGLVRCAARLAAVVDALGSSRGGGHAEDLVDAWLDARIRLAVAVERL